MKKILLLLAAVGAIFTACEKGSGVNGRYPSTPKIELSQQTIDVECDAATHSVSVTSPYSWKAVSENDWIEVKTTKGNAGPQSLSFSVGYNVEENERTGSIIIANSDYNLIAELYIIQKAFTPKISISTDSLSFSSEGETHNVAITANVEYEISPTANWISYTTTDKGVSITVSEYAEINPRNASVIISNDKYNISKTIKVVQMPFVPDIYMEKSELSFTAEYGTQDVAITANVDYNVSADADWLSVAGTGTGVKVTVALSTMSEERSANITIKNYQYNVSEVIKVVQKAVSYSDNHVITYTSSDNNIVTPNASDAFGANIVSNKYKNGKGMIVFDAPVTSIGDSAFASCSYLVSIIVPESVTSIGKGAFAGCYRLTSFTIPDNVQSIGYSCFAFCRSLSTFRGKYASEDGKCLVKDGELLSVSSSISGIYTLPNNVTKIGYNCITNTSYKVEIVIPDSVVELHDVRDEWVITAAQKISAFRGAFASTDGTALIKDDALFGAALYDLTSYTIPEGIKTIKANLFQNSKLETIIIPESISHIEKWAFNSCTKLKSVYCKATTPPTLGSYIFEDLTLFPQIYVPSESVEKYKSAARWEKFADSIVGYDF